MMENGELHVKDRKWSITHLYLTYQQIATDRHTGASVIQHIGFRPASRVRHFPMSELFDCFTCAKQTLTGV